MKYIRTNDNIYLLDNSEKYCDILKKEFYEIGDKHIYLDEIIKQADTIKELCDQYVPVKNGEIKGYNFMFVDDLIDYLKVNNMLNEYNIYGAIWTDKGLIYVAKLNKNKIWELL